MTADPAATAPMNWLWVCALLCPALSACEQLPKEYAGPVVLCMVGWQGVLTTDASAFNVQACYNSRCTSPISIQSAGTDAGSAVDYSDAACVPTTPGGPPSRCFFPSTPTPGCGRGEIKDEFTVDACAQTMSDGASFSVTLTPSTPSMPDGGDQFGLMIETVGGTSLVEASGRVPRTDPPTEISTDCRGAAFDLAGSIVAE